MTDFFASGRVADLILLVLAIEAVVLMLWHRRTGQGLDGRAILGLTLPGVALVLALRFALTGAWWGWIGLVLGAAFLAHLFDVATRFRR